MNENHLIIYEIKIFSFINKYKKIVDAVINFFDLVIINLIKGFEVFIFAIISVMKYTGKLMRYTTIPIHWLWIWWELKHKDHNEIEDLPWTEIGAYYIYAKPRAGKSTFMYHFMMHYAYHTGKCSYTTAMMETPRKNLDGSEYYYHQLFQPSDFYQDGVQIKGFDSKRFNMVVYEEMLTQYQQRNNSKKSYNDELLPMIAAMGTQAHQGIDLFFFISQLPRNDIAIMQMLKGYLEPKIKKGFDYPLWLNTGKIRFKILGWKMAFHEIIPNGGSDYKLVNKRTLFYKNTLPEEMKYFNKFNMKEKFEGLETMKGSVMNA